MAEAKKITGSITGSSVIKGNSNLTCTYGLTIAEETQSIENNETTISFEYYVLATNVLYFSGTTRPNAGTIKVKIDGKDVASKVVPLTNGIQNGMYIVSKTKGTVKVPHGSDGSKKVAYSIEMVTGTDQNNYNYVWNASSKTSEMTLTSIPRQSSFSLTGDLLGSKVTVDIARNVDTYTHKVEYDFNGSGYITASENVETSCEFTPSLDLASNIPNSENGTLTVKVTTYNENTIIGSAVTKTQTLKLPSNVIPTFSSLSLARVDNEVPSSWQEYVKGRSQVTCAIVGESGVYGSEIKSYSIVGGGYNTNEKSFTTGILNKAEEITFTATVTDSRGRTSNPITAKIIVRDYFIPSMSLKAERCLEDGTLSKSGTFLSITCPHSYASVNGKNKVSITVYCNGVYEEITGSSFILNANCSASKQYVVTASISDSLGDYIEPLTVTIPTDFRILNIKKNKKGIAYGKFAENDDEFDVNLLIRARKGIVDEDGNPFSGGGGDTLPIGSIVEWGSETIPTNWLLLNGQEVSREEYFELFELYGTRYGEGDGITTFNLPNRCGKVAVGLDSKDSDFDELGKTGGEKAHTLTVDEMPNHNHKHYQWIFHGGTATGGNHYGMSFQANTGILRARESYSTTGELQFGNEATGGDKEHNNLQPYIVVNFIVKAKQSKAILQSGTIIDNLNSNDNTMALSARMGKLLNEKIENVSGGTSGSSNVRIGEVVLTSSAWTGSGNLFSQVVTIDTVTENTQVDLTPNAQQLAMFYEKDVAFVTENEDGIVTVYAIGQKPQNDYTIQVTLTEVYYG